MGVLTQYLVVSRSLTGTNMDLFVTARDPLEAKELWRQHYIDWNRDEDDIRVFPVPDEAFSPTAHEWPEPVLDTRV